MARKKKAQKKQAQKNAARTRSTASKTKSATAKAKAPARSKKASIATAGRKPSSRKGAPRGTEVERCWAEYLQQRTSLEAAVEAVRSAEAELSQAREIERARRKDFDSAKESLERLLEVETASASRSGQRRKPLDLPEPVRAPSSDVEKEAALG